MKPLQERLVFSETFFSQWQADRAAGTQDEGELSLAGWILLFFSCFKFESEFPGKKKKNFDFEISTEYAGVSGKDDFEINISKEKSTEKYYSGYYGSPNSGNKVSITSDYGGISFYRN